MKRLEIVALAMAAAACGPEDASQGEGASQMDGIAEPYVRLVLAVGEHDSDYVDAFYGPAEWRDQASEEGLPQIDGEEAAAWLQQYAMFSPEGARQRMRFVDQYRSYVINYNLGQDLVRGFVDGDGETRAREDRWVRFIQLLTSPRLPGDL